MPMRCQILRTEEVVKDENTGGGFDYWNCLVAKLLLHDGAEYLVGSSSAETSSIFPVQMSARTTAGILLSQS